MCDMRGIIQIAGIIDRDEADMLVAEGVDWIGFPLRLTVNREDISEDRAGEIIRSLVRPTRAVLITYLRTADAILALCRKLGAMTVQLHGDTPLAETVRLKTIAPDIHVLKSLVVRSGNFETLKGIESQYADCVDGFITDTFDPDTGACGATGKTHDWGVSRRLVELSTRPVILAGGLTPDNVRQAILQVRPDGVDAHTGVEGLDGRKDRSRIRRFVAEARAAFSGLDG
jgi:phosphoribosylanthranilate isomerase